MPAPRLLDKRTVNASLATERKQEIDKGVQLAKAIDALRETRNQEEQALERFRTETARQVHLEIDALIKQRDNLRTEIQKLLASKE